MFGKAGPGRVKGAGDAKLDNAYSIMQSAENKLGGGEGVQGIYGSITRSGTQRIFDCMRNNCGFGGSSVLVDVGAGLGRPLIHALLDPGIKGAYGIELDEVKVSKAQAFIEQTMSEMARRGHMEPGMSRPQIHCQSIEEVGGFGSATHAYSFWEGIPASGRAAFGRLFASSKSLKCVAVVQRAMRGQHPTQIMESFGFGPLMLINNFAVTMSGSGASFQAYIFSKVPTATALLFTSMRTPGKPAATPTPASALVEAHAQAPIVVNLIAIAAATPSAGPQNPLELSAVKAQPIPMQPEEEVMVGPTLGPWSTSGQTMSKVDPTPSKTKQQLIGAYTRQRKRADMLHVAPAIKKAQEKPKPDFGTGTSMSKAGTIGILRAALVAGDVISAKRVGSCRAASAK